MTINDLVQASIEYQARIIVSEYAIADHCIQSSLKRGRIIPTPVVYDQVYDPSLGFVIPDNVANLLRYLNNTRVERGLKLVNIDLKPEKPDFKLIGDQKVLLSLSDEEVLSYLENVENYYHNNKEKVLSKVSALNSGMAICAYGEEGPDDIGIIFFKIADNLILSIRMTPQYITGENMTLNDLENIETPIPCGYCDIQHFKDVMALSTLKICELKSLFFQAPEKIEGTLVEEKEPEIIENEITGETLVNYEK